MSAEVALERLTPSQREHVLISDAPLVEGAILAAMNAGLGLSLVQLAASAQDAAGFPECAGHDGWLDVNARERK